MRTKTIADKLLSIKNALTKAYQSRRIRIYTLGVRTKDLSCSATYLGVIILTLDIKV